MRASAGLGMGMADLNEGGEHWRLLLSQSGLGAVLDQCRADSA